MESSPYSNVLSLEDTIEKCRGRKLAFVPFVTAGHGGIDLTIAALLGLQKSGADVIELGIPFSDPTADGPVIAKSSAQAIDSGTDMDACLQIVEEARKKGLTAPIVMMGYTNPILAFGVEAFARRAKMAAIGGVILVDIPPEVAAKDKITATLEKEGVGLIPLVSPATTESRLKFIAALKAPFVYCIALLGTTGVRSVGNWSASANKIRSVVHSLRSLNPKIKTVIGFGIAEPQQVKEIKSMCDFDGFVVGSHFVKIMDEATTAGGSSESLEKLTCSALNLNNASYFAEDEKTARDKALKSLSTESHPGSLPLATRTPCDFPVESADGYFGTYGGRYCPETLLESHMQLEKAFNEAMLDPEFIQTLDDYRRNFIGGPTPLYNAKRLAVFNGVKSNIWFKREDLAFTGSHKINNAIGQALLAKRMGKTRVVAETGAGQHGVATATACAHLGLECVIYMGAVDCERQKLNVFKMNLLNAKVVPVTSGSQTLKDAVNEALRDFVANVENTHFVIGSAIGSHPYPNIVRRLQSVIGKEVVSQMKGVGEFEKSSCTPRRLPDVAIACCGGGSNAIGFFDGFLNDEACKDVKLIGVEAGGECGPQGDKHCATLCVGTPGVLHGCKSYVLQDKGGQIKETHSICAGLDYPGVGPHHAALKDSKRAAYVWVTDAEALEAYITVCRSEGVIIALECAHAVAYALKLGQMDDPPKTILVMVSGRGDKDVGIVAKHSNVDIPHIQ